MEKRLANIERELLAEVYGCKKFHTYLFGHGFTVNTDYKLLKSIHLRHLTPPPPRLQRMLLRLQPHGLVIRYQPDKNIEIAVHSLGYHQKKKKPFMVWRSYVDDIHPSRELENKQVCRAQRVTIIPGSNNPAKVTEKLAGVQRSYAVTTPTERVNHRALRSLCVDPAMSFKVLSN